MVRLLLQNSSKAFQICFLAILPMIVKAQTSTVTLCESPNLFVNYSTTFTPGINFTPSIPAGHVVTDISVSITWSRKQSSCAGTFGTENVSEVEFSLVGPTGISRTLVGPGGSWSGTGVVNSFVNTFQDGATTISGFPVNGTTYGSALSLSSTFPIGTDFLGTQAPGVWRLEIVDNISNSTGICIEQYCITIKSCDSPPLIASCRASATLNLDTFGIRNPLFTDLNLLSDTSCMLNSVRFSYNPTGIPSLSGPFTCADVSALPVALYMVLTDKLGRTAVCPTPTLVTISDVTPPDVPECRIFSQTADTVYLNASGTATYNATELTPTDACGISSVQLSSGFAVSFGPSINFNCTAGGGVGGAGANNIYARVRDVNGNVRNSLTASSSFFPSCRIRILVFDTIPPVAICHNTRTFALDANGLFTATPTNIDNGSYTDCSPSGPLQFRINGQNSVTYNCDSLGTRTAILTVIENNTPQQGGTNTASCISVINVVDVTPPNAICTGTSVSLNAAGSAVINASTIAGLSTDNCGPLTYSFNTGATRTFSCADLGVNTVSVSVTDASGNVSTCNANITVTDVIAPTVECQNVNAYLDATGNVTVLATEIDNGSADICGVSSLLINTLASINYSCDSVGIRNVRLVAVDASGNSSFCWATVTVIDTIDPIAVCQNLSVYLNNSGLATVSATQVENGSSDNCSILNRQINNLPWGTPVTYTCDSLGIRVVSLQVNDVNGNVGTCFANVTVLDSIAPVAQCQNINAYIDVSGNVTVNPLDVNDNSIDNCGISLYQLSTLSSNCTTFVSTDVPQIISPVGTPTVTSSLPVVLPPGAVITNISVQNLAGTHSYINDISVSLTSPSGTTVPLFSNICTSQDNFSINFDDSGLPYVTIPCPPITTNTYHPQFNLNNFLSEDPSGNWTLTIVDSEVDDGGSLDSWSLNICYAFLAPVNYTCDSIGSRTVVLQVSDLSANSSSCTATVNVMDTIAPDAQCQNFDVFLNAAGVASVFTIDIDNGSSDNCDISSIQFAGFAVGASIDYNCDSTGVRFATLQVNDVYGNSGFCTATVTVTDSIRPLAICQNVTAYLNSAGTVTVSALQLNNNSSDICGINAYYINSVGNVDQNFSCGELGNNAVTLIVVDKSGNTTNCAATIEVLDTIKPQMICLNTNVFLNPSGYAVITPAMIDNGSNDACGFASLTVSLDTVRCANIGNVTVSLIGTDINGNTDSCTAIINVVDTVPPVAICQNATIYLNAAGSATLTAIDVDSGSSDNCNSISSIRVNGLDSVIYNCVDAGTQTVLLQIFDTNGNVGSCTTQVNIVDTIRPTASCQNVSLPLDASGNLTVSASSINLNSNDACGISTIRFNSGLNTHTFNCTNIGPNPVTLVVQDVNGNIDSCSATITVQDLTPPNAVCQPATLYLNALGVATLDPLLVGAASSDACGISTRSVFPSNFNCSNVSVPVIVTFTVTDNNSNSNTCQATVTIADTVRPTMQCTTRTVYLDAMGVVSVTATEIDGGTSDACGIVQRLINGNVNQIYDCSNLGLNNAQLTATDINNNSASCISTLTVADTVRPIARCRAPFTLFLSGITGNATLTPIMVDSSSTDNCSLQPSLYTINNQASITYGCVNAGSTQNITLRVVDGSNNFRTCATTVTIRDTTAPVAQCLPSITRNLSSASPASVNVAALALNLSSTDVCGGAALTFLINGQPTFNYTCANIGPNTATLTVIDPSGNQSTCTSVVIINDITPPIANCIGSYTLNLDSTGEATLLGSLLNSGSADNCGVSSFLVNGAASQTFTCANFGSTAVTVTVRDASGNSSNCTSIVTVQDVTPPIARCFTNPVDVYLNASSTVSIVGTMLDSASTDNCIISTRLVNNAVSVSYSCVNIGLNTLTLTVRDQANNSHSCTARVMVRDTVLPNAQCQNINAVLNPSGLVFVNATAINGPSSDNCILSTYLINGQNRDTFDCTNIGPNVATLTVIDNSGNQSSCQATITVIDNIAPSVTCNNRIFYLDAAGSVIVSPNTVGSASDICGVINYTIDNLPFRNYGCAAANTTFSDTIRAFDASGNSGVCVAQVTILDTIRPIASCINATVTLDSSGVAMVLPSIVNLNSSDNCTLGTLLLNNQPNITFNCANVGTNNVVLTVFDPSGNSATCPAQITVVDNIAPIARCRNIQVQLDAGGNVTVPAINLNASPSSYDACGPLSFTVNGQTTLSFNCSNLSGSNNVPLTVTDIHGNSSTCNSSITVLDVTPPSINCLNYTLHLDVTGNGFLVPQSVVNSALSFDNCNTISYTIDGSPTSRLYNCNDIGVNTILVVGSDPSGNRDTCFANVTVVDTVGPTINCQSIVVNLTSVVVDTLSLVDLGVTTFDACGIDTTVFFPNIITCANVGTIPIQITSFDLYGNANTCVSMVTIVLDGAQPSAVDSFLCENENLQLFANPPATGFSYNYNWQGPNAFASTLENPTLNNVQGVNGGLYIVTISPQGGVQGCAVTDTVYIDVNVVPPPIVTVSGSVCFGDSAVFFLGNQSSFTGTNITYQWFYEGIPVGTNSSTYVINPIAFSDTGAYTAIVNVDGCADTSVAPYNLIVNQLPPQFSPIASNPCLGDTLSLFANPPGAGPYTYSWGGPIGFSSNNRDPLVPFVLTPNSGLYMVTITDQNTCRRVGAVLVTIRELPDDPFIDYNDPLCVNDVLILSDTVTRATNSSFIWTTPAGIIDTTNLPQYFMVDPIEGTYVLYVIENGCVSIKESIDVVFELEPGAFEDIYTVPFRDSLMNLTVTLNDAIRSGYFITVVDSASHGNVTVNDDGTLNYVPDFNYHGLDSFVYQICDPVCPTICDEALVIVDVQFNDRCFIPNALSPNGDGINDELLVVCRELYPNMEIQIFSRWGNMVFQGEPNGWNGMFNGANLPDGAYFYILDFGDGSKPESGYLVISR
jgi:large repetitive protein